MAKRSLASAWLRSVRRGIDAATRCGIKAGARAAKQAAHGAIKAAAAPAVARRIGAKPKPATAIVPTAGGDWLSGIALATAGARRYQLFRPPAAAGTIAVERLPLLVMLHGCRQDAARFAHSTRMNRIAARDGFFVLYPEQDRHAHPHGCWNWYASRTGQADGEAAILAAAVDQVCRLYPVDRERVALAGLSAGASMAALMAVRQPAHYRALVMHSGLAPGSAQSVASALVAMQGRHAPNTGALAAALQAAAGSAGSAGATTPSASLPPLLVIQGDADATVVPSNGRAAAEAWAAALGAHAGVPRQLRRGQRHPSRVTDYKRAGRTLVSLCEVERLGHAWSGGDAGQPFGDAAGPDASKMTWAFVARQFGRD